MTRIEVAKDFSRFPAGRYRTDGRFSGEAFREDWLKPALRKGEPVHVVLDGVAGYGSSFLEEAFGGLAREGCISGTDLNRTLILKSESKLFDVYRKLAEDYIRKANPGLKRTAN